MAHVHGAAKAAVQHAAEAGAAKAAEHAAAVGAVKAAPTISFHNVPQAAVTASLAGRFLKNPWVLFGMGIAVGYFVHKHRKDIIEAANLVAEKGKDFVLQQRENLEDIVAESSESAD